MSAHGRLSPRAWVGLIALTLSMQAGAAWFLFDALHEAPRDRWVLFIACEVAAVLLAAVIVVQRPARPDALTPPRDV